MTKAHLPAADPADATDAPSWVERELAGCRFRDRRLGQRLRKLLTHMARAIGGSLPLACQDWANTKAAYRFLSNPKVNEYAILQGHFQATRTRFAAVDGPILVIQDTTELSYERAQPRRIGSTCRVNSGRDKEGRYRMHTVCGLLMHSCLAVTAEGLPLGLSAIKFWTRAQFKGTKELKRKINPTRVPIDQKESIRWLECLRQSVALFGAPERCIHIGDRENDIYEFFCTAHALGTHFLVRTCVDRLAGDGQHTIADEMQEVKVKGRHQVEVRSPKGDASLAIVELRYRRIHVLPPIGKQKRYPALTLTIIHAQERHTPKDRARIDWKLITDLPVRSRADAIQMLDWYALRWKVELFHKILKSGCRAEETKLRTAERLVNLLSIYCILSWRIFWMTMLNRVIPHVPPQLALTGLEIDLLDELVRDQGPIVRGRKTLSDYLTKIARMGGYLARGHDPPPGNTVMWRGLSRLMDIELGARIGAQIYG
ncbi:IS4 family transposase [Microvirga tunisiensis]|uniref:IS4 family transposase n=3 Tax=Microvirga tunisiensis TaxID=2108360 RepID=A0A5N7MWW1_9HYPH|nr:IS4 family transposase [Microvirga tunisiensis]MPR31441.1 IS4 family transposase [Microvirga tunisiensis]